MAQQVAAAADAHLRNRGGGGALNPSILAAAQQAAAAAMQANGRVSAGSGGFGGGMGGPSALSGVGGGMGADGGSQGNLAQANLLAAARQGAAAALNRDRYGAFHDRHVHGSHAPNPPRLSGSATYRPQLLSGSTLGDTLKRSESGSKDVGMSPYTLLNGSAPAEGGLGLTSGSWDAAEGKAGGGMQSLGSSGRPASGGSPPTKALGPSLAQSLLDAGLNAGNAVEGTTHCYQRCAVCHACNSPFSLEGVHTSILVLPFLVTGPIGSV